MIGHHNMSANDWTRRRHLTKDSPSDSCCVHIQLTNFFNSQQLLDLDKPEAWARMAEARNEKRSEAHWEQGRSSCSPIETVKAISFTTVLSDPAIIFYLASKTCLYIFLTSTSVFSWDEGYSDPCKIGKCPFLMRPFKQNSRRLITQKSRFESQSLHSHV